MKPIKPSCTKSLRSLLTDMGRYKVRMHLRTTDVKAVWKEYSEYMTTAYKGASKKRKLTQYVTNTALLCAIRPRTLKNPNQRLVATGGEEDHQPHPKNHGTSNFFYRYWYTNHARSKACCSWRGGRSPASSQNHETSKVFYE